MRNGNENCLDDMGCPECSSAAPFFIEVKGWDTENRKQVAATVEMWDDGFDEPRFIGDTEWDGDSPCACPCGHTGTVEDFKLVSALELLARCADQDEERSQ